MKQRGDVFRSCLKANRLKFTRTRELVWQEVQLQPDVHRNAADIYQSLKKKGSKISLATIYRTLNLLVKSGLVRSEDLGEKHSHFEPETPGAAHGHLICLGCGRVQEFEEEKLKLKISAIGRRHGFHLEKYSLQVFGFCDQCRRAIGGAGG